MDPVQKQLEENFFQNQPGSLRRWAGSSSFTTFCVLKGQCHEMDFIEGHPQNSLLCDWSMFSIADLWLQGKRKD
jgi:hypothetical protein